MSWNRTIPFTPTRDKERRRGGVFAAIAGLLAGLVVGGCSSPEQSFFVYQLPYENGTQLKIWQDHTTHSGGEFAIDMAGTDTEATIPIVAARSGTVRVFQDTSTDTCAPSVGCNNNYIWIQHTGSEWTKYTHLMPGSVTASLAAGGANLSEGDGVAAGQLIGREGNIGMVSGSNDGQHLHFEVREVTDTASPNPDSAGDLAGTLRIPRFCGVSGQIAVKGEFYTASACPP